MAARILGAAIVAVALIHPLALADNPKKNGAKNKDYSELSRLIQQEVVAKAPKRHEDSSGWDKTIPLPPFVRFPRLRRMVVQKNGRPEVPDGIWKRYVVWLDDPAKDIKIAVRELKPAKTAGTYRIKLDATVAAHGEGERQRWRNGVRLFGISVQADAVITAALTIDAKVSLDGKTFPPQVVVEPKVVESKLVLERFDLNRVGPVVLLGDDARLVGEELKGFLQGLLTQYDSDVKEVANAAIAKALKEGKGRISAASLLKLAGHAKGQE